MNKIYKQIAQCFYDLKEWKNALKYFDLCEDPDVIKYQAECYDNLNDVKNAIKYYKKLLNNNDYQVYGNLARLYSKYGYFYKKQQLYYIEKAYELSQDYITLLNLILIYDKFNYTEKAQYYFNKLLNYKDVDPAMLFCYGGFLIRNKQFKKGYYYYRNRFKQDKSILPDYLHDLWQPGMYIKDKTLLIRYEQGYGDTFMYLRFVKDIPCKKLVIVQDDLTELLSEYNVIPESKEKDLQYDYFIPFMDLPLLLGTEPDNIPYKSGYINFNKKINLGNKFNIAITFEGGISGKGIYRDIPLKELYPIIELPNVHIFCLQKEDVNNQISKVPKHYPFTWVQPKDWIETATYLNSVDLTISTDNGVLNLAGALGVKTFALFNKYVESRWFSLDKDIGWYNIKPFQCTRFNHWKEPVNKIVEKIKNEYRERIF